MLYKTACTVTNEQVSFQSKLQEYMYAHMGAFINLNYQLLYTKHDYSKTAQEIR